ncbi:MAG: DUF456 domain-containing protein [Gemmatimonadota bacterium]
MAALLLAVVLLLSLVLIPLGLPGIWLMVAAGVTYALALPGTIGTGTLVGVTALALAAEVMEFTLAARYTRKSGGTRRGAWGALIGGLIGGVVGMPVPVIGPILGALVGSFAGALIGEWTGGMPSDQATRAATGAAIGRALAIGLKAAAGCAMAAWLIGAALVR